jgi:hypothetical protein
MRAFLLLLSAPLLFAESAAGVHWTMPQGWTGAAAQPVSAAVYRGPVAEGEFGAAERIIYPLSPADGSVEANLQRLREAFKGSGGKAESFQAKTLRLHGLPVAAIDISGNYGGSGAPEAPAYIVKRGWRMFGAIIEAPEATY